MSQKKSKTAAHAQHHFLQVSYADQYNVRVNLYVTGFSNLSKRQKYAQEVHRLLKNHGA